MNGRISTLCAVAGALAAFVMSGNDARAIDIELHPKVTMPKTPTPFNPGIRFRARAEGGGNALQGGSRSGGGGGETTFHEFSSTSKANKTSRSFSEERIRGGAATARPTSRLASSAHRRLQRCTYDYNSNLRTVTTCGRTAPIADPNGPK